MAEKRLCGALGNAESLLRSERGEGGLADLGRKVGEAEH